MRPNLLDTAGYQPQTVEKVERLLELLAEFGGHPFLGPRARLHGGTALNVFHLGMPRLSVDADLTYVGQVTKEGLEAERPEMERALTELGTRLGYSVSTSGKVAHSGRTFKLRYGHGDQRDLIKVDLIYLNRAPLLDYEQATCTMCSPETSVMTLALPELIAGKTKALFDRLAVRDLYDVYRIHTGGLPVSLAAGDDDVYRLQRRVRIYYASLSMPFPCPIDGRVVEKFASRASEVEDELYPVLNVHDRPTLEAMMESAARYIDEHVAPREDEEQEYLRRLEESSEYVPRLLFAPWPAVLARAEVSPAAEWKVMNLRKRPAEPEGDYPEW
ncbi:MAG: nucleotidyl transferase AbiEii/AbiGii toxin family protein [Coriobacteriia bacterium]|jgi:hypothetical protein|nr:nucleotidyl transferase AbiEii/AbiGii toxin family protein [Coriobacteriia bacterium]